MTNPNRCATCDHKRWPDGGHCYMFRDEPADVCMQHTGRRLLPREQRMTIKDLVKAVDAIEIGPEQMTRLRESLAESERQFDADQKRRAITEEWLNRRYTL